jgi:hypothetical protein
MDPNSDLLFPPPKGPEPPAPSGPIGYSTSTFDLKGTRVEWECLLCEQLKLGVPPTVEEHSLRCPKRDPATKS